MRRREYLFAVEPLFDEVTDYESFGEFSWVSPVQALISVSFTAGECLWSEGDGTSPVAQPRPSGSPTRPIVSSISYRGLHYLFCPQSLRVPHAR